jgi:hypothetical protein
LSSNPLFEQSEPSPPPLEKSLEQVAHKPQSDGSSKSSAKGQTNPETEQATPRSTHQSTHETTDRPTDKATSRSTGQSTEQSTEGPIARLKIVDRPKAFYITEDVDQWINKAVQHFRKQGLRKVDRSTVITAILHDPDLWQAESLDTLMERVVRHLTNRSIG